MDKKILLRMDFGSFIKLKRKECNLTQGELASLIGISYQYIGDIERGKKLPSIIILFQLKEALNMSLDDLYSHLEPMLLDQLKYSSTR